MDLSQFVAMVSEMRNAQKLYFKSRSREVLDKSIKLEKEVDAEIARFYNPQGDLFEGVRS